MRILAASMVTGVGLDGPSSAAAIRVGLNRFVETPFHDSEGRPVVGSPVPEVTEGCAGIGRYLALVTPALRECLAADPAMIPSRTTLLLGMPEPTRPGRPSGLDTELLPSLEGQLGVRFHTPSSAALAHGRASGLTALARAREALQATAVDRCIVAGVDSYLNQRDLKYFEQERRLKTESNSDGFIPGEGAGAVVLARTECQCPGPKVEVMGIGLAGESSTVSSEDPCRGRGLCEAIRNALKDAKMTMGEIKFRLADVTGERYGFQEVAHAFSQIVRQRIESFPLWHITDCTGEVGAAGSTCLLAVAWYALNKGYAPGHVVLVTASANGEQRAAAVIHVS
jgi:3-oxoacyl-[acyl-carrier-protein] synthase-1